MYNRSFFRNMDLLRKEIVKTKNKEKGDIWLEVKDFILTGCYSSYKQCSELVGMVLSGYSDSYIARNFNVEENTVRIHKRNISNELYALFGKDFFDLFENFQSNKKLILARLNNAKYCDKSFNDLLPDVISALVSTSIGIEEPLDYIDLNSCHKEISFLVRHSLDKIKGEFRGLDVLKLEYLTRVLNRKSGTVNDRQELLALLIEGGNITND